MKKIILGLILIGFFGCKKTEEFLPDGGFGIKKITTYTQNDTITRTYSYDSLNRLIQSTESRTYYKSFNTSQLQYLDSIIIISDYENQNLTLSHKKYLNMQGQVIKSSIIYPDDYVSTLFQYDFDGFMSSTRSWCLQRFTQSEGNIVQYYFFYQYPGEDQSEIKIVNYDYYKEYANTIFYPDQDIWFLCGTDNIGMNFYGKQNKNLIKSITRGTSVYNFYYHFDESNRVKEIEVYIGDTNWQLLVYEYYQ